MSAAAITYYSIPWSLGEYTNKLILAIAQTFVPVFSEQEATQGNQAIYATYVTGTKVMLIVSNLLCLGVLAVGDYFVALWMGPTYAEKCSAVLSIIFLTQLIKGPQLLSYSILLGTSNHRIFSFYNFSFSILNLILSIILIQKYELVGVAIGTAITQILFYGVITPILTSRVIRSSLIRYFRDTYLRAIPSSILLFVVLKYLANNNAPDSYFELIGQALMAASLYAVVAYWTLLGSEERAYLSSTVSRFAARA
jgi:O-antigen/teichoic acid export membrane protein